MSASEGHYTLTITNAQKSNEGDYTLLAKSAHGQMKFTASLLVLGMLSRIGTFFSKNIMVTLSRKSVY